MTTITSSGGITYQPDAGPASRWCCNDAPRWLHISKQRFSRSAISDILLRCEGVVMNWQQGYHVENGSNLNRHAEDARSSKTGMDCRSTALIHINLILVKWRHYVHVYNSMSTRSEMFKSPPPLNLPLHNEIRKWIESKRHSNPCKKNTEVQSNPGMCSKQNRP